MANERQGTAWVSIAAYQTVSNGYADKGAVVVTDRPSRNESMKPP